MYGKNKRQNLSDVWNMNKVKKSREKSLSNVNTLAAGDVVHNGIFHIYFIKRYRADINPRLTYSHPVSMMLGLSGLHFQTTLSNGFSLMKIFEFQIRFDWSLFQKVQLTIISIGSDNGLAPSRRQVIIWNNDGLSWWCIYASLALSESKQWSETYMG